MEVTHPGSMWFGPMKPLEDMYRSQADWRKTRRMMEARLSETSIAWFWLQRRGHKKWPPARLKAALGQDIEIYRKPSLATRYDITPPELLEWTAPAERNLSQLGLTRKDLGENPLWDVWVRIAPPVNPDFDEQRRAERYIKDKTYADRFESERLKRVERERGMTALELDMEDISQFSYRDQVRIRREYQWEKADETIRKIEDHKARKRRQALLDRVEKNTALRVLRENKEKGRQRVAAAALAPRGVKK